MRIAIVGLSGVGTSSISKALAETMGWDPEKSIFSIGDEFRKEADRKKLELAELRDIAIKGSSKIDDHIDGRAKDFFRGNENCIVEGRLAAFHAPEGVIKILLICTGKDRFVRIMKRGDGAKRKYRSYEEARLATIQREEEDRARYLKIYGAEAMNFDDPRNFSFSPFVTNGREAEENAEIVKAAIESIESLA